MTKREALAPRVVAGIVGASVALEQLHAAYRAGVIDELERIRAIAASSHGAPAESVSYGVDPTSLEVTLHIAIGDRVLEVTSPDVATALAELEALAKAGPA